MSFLSGILNYGKTAVKFLSKNSWASTLAKTALLGYAVNRLSRNALKDNDAGTNNIDEGVRLQIAPSAESKIPVLYGRAYFGGNISDAAMTNNNKTMWYCLVLSEKTGAAYSTGIASDYTFNNIYWNDQRIVFANDGITADYTVDRNGTIDRSISGLVKVYCYKGGRVNGVIPVGYAGTVPNAETIFPNWTSGTHAMEDLIFALVRVDYNRERNVTGIADMLFDITNSVKYPGDVIYDYLTNTRYGCGIAAGDILTTDITALNTYSQENLAYDDQGTGAQTLDDRYQINGLLDTANPVLENAEAILSAAASWLSYDSHQGKWGVVINKADTSVASFDDSNILGSVSVSGTGIQDLYNSVKVEFPHRDLRDSADFVQILIPIEDRNANEENNILNLTYDIINEPIQAQLLGFIELKQSRVDKIVRFQTDFSYYNLKAGDVITVSAPIGLSADLFRIISITEQQDDSGALIMDITALEYDSSVYATDDLYRFTRSDADGIITIGSIGVPGTPQATKIEVDARPRVIINTTAPTGVVEGIEYWLSTDFNQADDSLRSYTLIATKRPTGGGVYTSGTTVSLDYDQIGAANFYVKTRGFNTTTVGPYSSPSGLVEFAPTQVTDAIGPDTSALDATGNLLTALAIIDLLKGLDDLYAGVTGNGSIFEKVFEAFEDVTGIDLVGDAASGIIELTIQEEGATVASSTSIINFVGSNVTATASGNTVTVTVDVPEFTGETVLVDGQPEIGQTIAWNGTAWVPVDSCCDNLPDPGEPGGPPVPPTPQCFLTLSSRLPPDRSTFIDPITGYQSDLAPITGSYFMGISLSAGLYGPVDKGTGNVRLYKSDGTLVQTLPASSLTVSGNVVGFPFVERDLGTDYYILMDEGVITYCDCKSPAITLPTTWNFNTAPYATTAYAATDLAWPPPLSSVRTVTIESVTSPSCFNSITINFNRSVVKGSGTVTVRRVNDDVSVGSFNSANGVASGSSITYSGLSLPSGFFYIVAPAGIALAASTDCKISASNPSAAVQKTDNKTFSTVALLYSYFEVDSDPFVDPDKTKVNRQTNIRLYFNKPIFFRDAADGDFFFRIYESTGTLHQQINTKWTFDDNRTSELIWISGGNVLNINPTRDLTPGKSYYVTADNGSLRDSCPTFWSGISSNNVIVFTVDAGPQAPTASTNNNGSINESGIGLAFDRDVVPGPGQMIIYDSSNNVIATIEPDDPAVLYT